jgi:DNA-binding IclR family transcriptional regulator
MPGSNLVQSVQRALDIVQAVCDAEAGLSLAEIARAIGVHETTVHNLARTLASRGVLQKAGRPVRYTIGPALPELVRRARKTRFLEQAALVMRDLAHQLPSVTWTLTQKSGSEFLVKLRMSPEHNGLLQRPEHRSLSPYGSASALVYQAFLPPDELQTFREQYPFDDYGQQRWLTRRKFDAFLASVRRKGYALPAVEDDRLILARPVFEEGRQIVAVLGAAMAVPGPRLPQIVPEMVRRVREAAARMERSLP